MKFECKDDMNLKLMFAAGRALECRPGETTELPPDTPRKAFASS